MNNKEEYYIVAENVWLFKYAN